MAEAAEWIAQLADPDPARREAAAANLYAAGCAAAEPVLQRWRADAELATLFAGPPTVGIAVQPDTFERIRRALGSPRLADVPPDQDAREFEVQIGAARLDVITTRDEPHAPAGAIAKFLARFGEGIQQVEFPVRDVDRATALVRARDAIEPVYPATRPGADGTRVNFFLVPAGDKKVLIELVEQ